MKTVLVLIVLCIAGLVWGGGPINDQMNPWAFLAGGISLLLIFPLLFLAGFMVITRFTARQWTIGRRSVKRNYYNED